MLGRRQHPRRPRPRPSLVQWRYCLVQLALILRPLHRGLAHPQKRPRLVTLPMP
jgi:hypothetical protein